MNHRFDHYKKPHENYHRALFTPALMVGEPPIEGAIDLRPHLLPVRDQGQEGCCSGFATAALQECLTNVALAPLTPMNTQDAATQDALWLSPAYLYARTRIAEGTFPRDAGARIVDELMTLFNYGTCPESMLPYNGDPTIGSPTPELDAAAARFKSLAPTGVNMTNPIAIETALAKKQPIAFGMPVTASFEKTGSDGMVPAPGGALLGGHAMLCVGYDRAKQLLTIRNSWSAKWGDGGYCYMPYTMAALWWEAYTSAVPTPVQPATDVA